MQALKQSRGSKKKLLRGIFEPLEGRTLLSAYVVATTGSDSNAGTATAPWKTLQKAANVASAGDVITVKSGNYAGFYLDRSGSASAPITFKAESGATITGRNATTGDGINLEGANYIVIDGFTVDNSAGTISRAGIRSVINNHTTLRNNHVYNATTWGIYISHSDYALIESNRSHDNNFGDPNYWNHHGIYVSDSSQYPTVRNNVVYNNGGNGIHFNGDASQGGTGMVVGAVVEGNIVYNNGANGGSAINCDGVRDSVFRNNLLYNNHAKGLALYTIDAAAGSTNNTIVNNTIVQASGAGPALTLKDGATGVNVVNNILLGGTDFQNSPGTNSNNITTSSSNLFVNSGAGDYHLAAGSPAIDKGTSSYAPATDLEGKSRPAGAGYDIGAYEYNGGTTPTPAPTAPSAPGNLSASASSASSISLTWTDNASNETGFKIEQSTGGGAFTQVATVGAGVTNFTVTGLTASTAYSYRVRATNSAGDSAYSNTASATTQAAPAPAPAPTPAPPTATAPASPTNLAAAASSGTITLTWSDNSDNETSFRLDRASDGVNFTQIATINADVTSYADTSVTAGTTYTYRIKAINSVGGSVWSNLASATASGTTPTPPPSGKPASTGATLTATASTGRITLAWADKSNNESGFWIERSTDGKSFSKLTQTVADVTNFVDTSVVAGVTYTYRIRAFNSSGNSVWSNLASAKAV